MTSRPSKRQQQAAATQDQLLCAARAVFAERGYQATTVGAITSAANTAHGTFYLYFRNKHDAFAVVMDSVADELYREADTADAGLDARGTLELSIRRFLDVFVRERRLWRCLLEGSFTNPDVEGLWLAMRNRFVERIARDLRLLGESGLIRPLDPDITANALGGMVEWAAMTQFVLETGPAAGRSIDETVGVLTDIWMAAVFAEVPTPVTR